MGFSVQSLLVNARLNKIKTVELFRAFNMPAI